MQAIRKWTCALSTLLVWIGVTACSSAPVILEKDAAWLERFSTTPVPGGLQSGLPASPLPERPPGKLIVEGDRMLFELQLLEAGSARTRYLEIEVQGLWYVDGVPQVQTFTFRSQGTSKSVTSPGHEVRLNLYDEQGVLLESSQVHLAEGVVADHVANCDAFDEYSQLPDEEAKREFAERYALQLANSSFQSLLSLFGLAQDDDLLSKLLWDVCQKPNLLSVALSMGITANLQPGYDKASKIVSGPEGLTGAGPLRSFPIAVSINDKLAVSADLLVLEPLPPFSLTGGIVALEARHPSKDVQVRARLVGASAGPSQDPEANQLQSLDRSGHAE